MLAVLSLSYTCGTVADIIIVEIGRQYEQELTACRQILPQRLHDRALRRIENLIEINLFARIGPWKISQSHLTGGPDRIRQILSSLPSKKWESES